MLGRKCRGKGWDGAGACPVGANGNCGFQKWSELVSLRWKFSEIRKKRQ